MSNKPENMEYGIVTEVGTFGSLNIEDPTVTPIDPKNKSVNELIEEAIQQNKDALL